MGTIAPPEGFDWQALEIGLPNASPRRDGTNRHTRMFRDREFDICEQSLASYIISKSRGGSFTATPVFPRRLFSQNCMFVNVDAGIETPRDLRGKKVGINSFQTTLSVLAKGDLKFDYGVPWEDVNWFVQYDEELAWENSRGLPIQKIPAGETIGQMLVNGELDAMFHPLPPAESTTRSNRVRRLFTDCRGEATAYFHRYGYCPIMHVMVMTQELVEREPWIPMTTLTLWEEAKKKTEAFYDDPSYSLLLFGRNELERQREVFGDDPWPSGLAANRPNLERFISYLADQGLIDAGLSVDSLFDPSTLDT
jgi:4,5-dihydroxyphthalate decarboxylase